LYFRVNQSSWLLVTSLLQHQMKCQQKKNNRKLLQQ
jgi:hypothetical protein